MSANFWFLLIPLVGFCQISRVAAAVALKGEG